MQKLVVTTFVSIDGVMQGPGAPDEDRSGGFDLGGWLVPSMDEAVAGFAAEWIQLAGGILLGRRTYQMLAGYWPHVSDPADVLARHLNRLPKFVVSRTLERADWANTTILRGDLRAEVARLKATGHGELQLHGSLNVASQPPAPVPMPAAPTATTSVTRPRSPGSPNGTGASSMRTATGCSARMTRPRTWSR